MQICHRGEQVAFVMIYYKFQEIHLSQRNRAMLHI